jgi:L-amino acid N-acyltransferase YncA
MEWSIRSAAVEDAAPLRDIYAYYVKNTCVSFETETPSLEEFAARVRSSLERYAYLVCEVNGEIAGYAYAGPFRARGAYLYTASPSVYIKEGFHRQGIGRALYERLFELLLERGFYTLVAGVALPNPGSVGLHKAMGFQEVGVYRNVGYKFGQWIDTLWLQKALRAYDMPEETP